MEGADGDADALAVGEWVNRHRQTETTTGDGDRGVWLVLGPGLARLGISWSLWEWDY